MCLETSERRSSLSRYPGLQMPSVKKRRWQAKCAFWMHFAWWPCWKVTRTCRDAGIRGWSQGCGGMRGCSRGEPGTPSVAVGVKMPTQCACWVLLWPAIPESSHTTGPDCCHLINHHIVATASSASGNRRFMEANISAFCVYSLDLGCWGYSSKESLNHSLMINQEV